MLRLQELADKIKARLSTKTQRGQQLDQELMSRLQNARNKEETFRNLANDLYEGGELPEIYNHRLKDQVMGLIKAWFRNKRRYKAKTASSQVRQHMLVSAAPSFEP